MSVLLMAVVVPGMNIQVTLDLAGIAWVRYWNATLLVAVGSGLVFAVVYVLSGRRIALTLRITASLVFVFFLWPLFSRVDVVGGAVGALLVVLAPFVIIYAAARYGDRAAVVLPMVVLASVVFIGVGYQALGRGIGEPQYDQFEPIAASPTVANPDVLMVLLDGYARDDVLQNDYGYDNSGFLGALSRSGFVVNPNTSANYTRTYASLGSVMDLDYPVPAGPISDETNAELRMLLEQSGSLVNSFVERGYDITVAESAWYGSHCGPLVDHCWRESTTRSSAYYLSLLTPIAPVVQANVPHPFHTTSWNQLLDLSASFTAAADRSNPQFMFVHLDLPHPPLNLDASCNLRYESWRHGLILAADADGQDQESIRRRAAYVEQTECVNATLMEELAGILAAFPDTSVLLFSDHGPDGRGQLRAQLHETTQEGLYERLGILSAARTPEHCDGFESALTLVNVVRGFTGCVLSLELGPLPDHSFWVPSQSSPAPVVEVELSNRSS
ncbi:MAG: sulfatase-like hydrolase/transferase [Acidimicrobiia bacterium]